MADVDAVKYTKQVPSRLDSWNGRAVTRFFCSVMKAIGCKYIIGQFACNCYLFLYNAERTFYRKKKNNGMSSEVLL